MYSLCDYQWLIASQQRTRLAMHIVNFGFFFLVTQITNKLYNVILLILIAVNSLNKFFGAHTACQTLFLALKTNTAVIKTQYFDFEQLIF